MQGRPYTESEEKLNTITHAIGAGLSIIALILLLIKASKTTTFWDDFSFLVYGISLIVLYIASTVYHGVKDKRLKRILNIVDHIAIFLLIAGTYTPVTLLAIEGTVGDYVFAAIWTLAFLGIIFKLFYTGKYNVLSVLIYLAMGWMAVVIYDPLVESLQMPALMLILGGGIFYSGGTLFYLWEKLPHHHAVWHVMVILGSVCHFLAIYFFI